MVSAAISNSFKLLGSIPFVLIYALVVSTHMYICVYLCSAYLFHIWHTGITPTLRAILACPQILKVGLGSYQDARKLKVRAYMTYSLTNKRERENKTPKTDRENCFISTTNDGIHIVLFVLYLSFL